MEDHGSRGISIQAWIAIAIVMFGVILLLGSLVQTLLNL